MPEYIITYTDQSADSSLGGSIKLNTGLPLLTSKPVAPPRTVASVSPTPAVVSPPQTAPLGNVQMEDSNVSLASDGGKRQAVATDSVKDDVDKQTSVTPPSHQSKGNTGTQLSNEFKESLETGSCRASASRWRDQSATVSQEVLEREQAEYSNEFKENIKASARPQRNTRDAVSQEVLEDQYSEELRQNEAAVSQMERGKDEPGSVVMGQRLTWHQQDPADHDRRLEAVRDKLQMKKHRRFKGKQAKPEDQAPSQVKVAAASHDEQLEEVKQIMRDKRQKDRLAAASAKKEDDTTTDSVQGKNEGSGEVKVVTDKQALQIREYLKTQHKKLQLRKADEESIGKVESLLVAYCQTYGSVEGDGTGQSEMKPIAKTDDTTITPGVVGGQQQDELTQGITARGPPFGADLEPSLASNNNVSSVLRGYIEDDPVDKVLKAQIEQFKEFTGVTDDEVAKDFLKKAGMQIDEAISLYFN
ncbi:uncharacterized protein [Ptychodera flava]|uniref:uncharacterized protein n=1 Tax=Ptychodera flava TaxID=63121 RepID=UPI00396A22C3